MPLPQKHVLRCLCWLWTRTSELPQQGGMGFAGGKDADRAKSGVTSRRYRRSRESLTQEQWNSTRIQERE